MAAKREAKSKNRDFVHVFLRARGSALQRAVMLGLRYPPKTGPEPAFSECGILETTGSDEEVTLNVRWRVKSMLAGIWRSTAGVTYVGDVTRGALLRVDDISHRTWSAREIPLPDLIPEGVFGFDDEHVYVWGVRPGRNDTNAYPLLMWDGKRFQELPIPPGSIAALDGSAPDRLYAVGSGGVAGRFDGMRWHRFDAPTYETLLCVHATADEQWACGRRGNVFRATKDSWEHVASNRIENAPGFAIASFRGKVFVAGGPQGLLELVDGELKVKKRNVPATWLHASNDYLLITCPEQLCGTADGEAFEGAVEGRYKDILEGEDILV